MGKSESDFMRSFICVSLEKCAFFWLRTGRVPSYFQRQKFSIFSKLRLFWGQWFPRYPWWWWHGWFGILFPYSFILYNDILDVITESDICFSVRFLTDLPLFLSIVYPNCCFCQQTSSGKIQWGVLVCTWQLWSESLSVFFGSILSISEAPPRMLLVRGHLLW